MGLIVDSANFSYGIEPVLKDISFTVAKGSFCAILGSNGSGKTTLLKSLNKLITLDSGNISINSHDIFALPQNEIAKLVSFVPQEHDNIAPYSVIEIVVMGMAPYLGVSQLPKTKDYDHARAILKTLNAQHLEDKLFNQISGGERQIAILARALVQQAPFILLDEPSNHLDFSRKSLLLKILKKVCIEDSKTIITTTHDPNLISSLADYVLLIKNGKICYEGLPETVLTSGNLSDIYGVSVKSHVAEDGKVLFYSD